MSAEFQSLVLHGIYYSLCTCYLIVLGIQESQNAQEQIYKVEVEVDGSKDVFVGRQLPHQHVGVKDDESAEQQSTTNRDDQLKGFTPHKHLHTDGITLCRYDSHMTLNIKSTYEIFYLLFNYICVCAPLLHTV